MTKEWRNVMLHLAHLVMSICNNAVKMTLRSFAAACLILLGILALPAALAHGQQSAVFPKYQVLGVIYAPPGSASSVTYSQSEMVGSSTSISSNFSQNYNYSLSIGAESQFLGWSSFSASASSGSGWGFQTSNSNSVAIQTTKGNSVATAGPVSSALGVNHDNDIIYILLNPVAPATNVNTSSTGGTFTWAGIAANSCDMTDSSDQMNVFQTVGGCDPNQYPFADIVGIPVWCLKNPYYPGQSCAQWLPYTSRSWDKAQWGTDQSTGLPLGPMLTLRDYADILSQDPFVTQTLLPFNAVPNFYCHQNPVGSGTYAYGVNLDPNDSELSIPTTPPTINPFTLPESACLSAGGTYTAAPSASPYCSWSANFCGTAPTSSSTPTQVSMQRFDPYDTVQYPEPGINGEPQTYGGYLSYQTTSTNGQSSQSTSSTMTGNNISVALGPCIFGCATINYTTSDTWAWQQSNNNQNTNESTSQAQYSIVGPQLSDNYQGPTTYNVYKDNVFGTFAFYSDMQREQPPIQLSGSAVPTAIPPNGLLGPGAPITVVFNTSTSSTLPTFPSGSPTTWNAGSLAVGGTPVTAWVQLADNSPYPMTMVGWSITFSDPAFTTILANDYCSNQVLYPAGSKLGPNVCAMQIQFQPVLSDAPQKGSYPITANLVAAGTENISGYQNILVTSTGVLVSGTATAGSTLLGATLLVGNPPPSSGATNIYAFPSTSTYIVANQPQEPFTFANISTSSMTITQIVLTDPIDFYVQSISCPLGSASNSNPAGSSNVFDSGNLTPSAPITVNSATSCVITVQFTPQSPKIFTTGISVMGTIAGGSSVASQLAGAGASGTETAPLVSVNPSSLTSSENYEEVYTGTGPYSCQQVGGGTVASSSIITLTNNTSTAVNYPLASYSDSYLSMSETLGTCSSVSGGYTVPAGKSCTINLGVANKVNSEGCPVGGSVSDSISPGVSVDETFNLTEICAPIQGCIQQPNAGTTIEVSSPNATEPIAIHAGSSESTTLQVSSESGFSGDVSFYCKNLPTNASCTFEPPTVTLSGNGSQSTKLTISVAAPNATASRGSRPLFPVAALAALLCFAGMNKRNRSKLLFVMLVSILGLASLSACGTSATNVSPSPTATSTITVVATAGNVSSSVGIPIAVTQ
jgi:hypothetical protein